MELLPLVFSDADMTAMLKVRAAFDPLGLCNPGKIIPMLRGCGEGRAVSLTPDVISEIPSVRAPQPLTAVADQSEQRSLVLRKRRSS